MGKDLDIVGWHVMRKEELVRALVNKSRSKVGAKKIHLCLKKNVSPSGRENTPKKAATKQKSKVREKVGSKSGMPFVTEEVDDITLGASTLSDVPNRFSTASKTTRQAQGAGKKAGPRSAAPMSLFDLMIKRKLNPDISSPQKEGQKDQLALMVRDPYWLHAFWEIGAKTIERAKVAMGHLWHSAVPLLRLFKVESDGTTHPKKRLIRDIVVHGGVNHWYLDVIDPPSVFQAQIGYMTHDRKFLPLVSSNSVETPQNRVLDELEQLDGNWKGVSDDLGRVYKMSSGSNIIPELKQVFEEKLGRPMSAPLLSRLRLSQQGPNITKTKRNFSFLVDADVVIFGKTDPSVQVTIRNEPIAVNPSGAFSARFSLPEKRHIFMIEAEGNDGIETQRMIFAIERNTKVLETLFADHNVEEDD